MTDVGAMTQCPKCGLEAKTLLHPFCTHQQCPVRDAVGVAKPRFRPDWKLTVEEEMAVALNLALNAHVPDWPGCTDEQLDAVVRDVIKAVGKPTFANT